MSNFDAPKSSIKEDELGYSYLAYYLAKIIKEISPQNNAYVIGICGKWGDGKTTLINYIKEILCYSYQNKCNLDINNYKNILGEIKSNKVVFSTQNMDNKTRLNKLAIFNAITSFVLVTITLLVKFNINVIHLGFINNYLICTFLLLIFSIPSVRNYLHNLIKELFFNFLLLFYEKNKSLPHSIEIIDFNPWTYQKNEKDITENFFKVLGQKIDIKEKNSNINIFLQYATCLLGLKFPDIKCNNRDFINLKTTIVETLKKENKKYLVIIDDLDRIQAQEAAVVFKAVKLLADFPNIIYLLSYDKEHLMNQYPFQNSNYIQKIVQLEKNLPIIPPAKLKEIYINRINNIIGNDTNLNIDDFTKIYDYSINKLIKNIRDINRFENSFNLSYIANKNVNEIHLIDYILISLLEEFDKTTYNLIQQNKHLLFEIISPIDLKKHTDFIQHLSKNAGFATFIILFANYLDTLEEVMNSVNNKTTTSSSHNSDVSQHEISRILDLFKFRYKTFVPKDNYRKISNKDFFDNYFLTSTITSIITDIEYKSLIDSCSDIEEFKNRFIDIFSKNEDKFKDFCERLTRDSNFINRAENITNLVKGILNLNDDLLLRLFDIRNFCEDLLSILQIGKTITKHNMLNILIENFSETNIIQQIYWYHELSMSNIDEYFKIEKFKTFNLNELKTKINTSNIRMPENIMFLINILIKIRICGLKPANFKELTNNILTDTTSALSLLKQCDNVKDCYFYFEFSEIQDLLIQYYFGTKGDYLGDTRFRTNIVLKILDENLKTKVTTLNNQLTNLSSINSTIKNAIQQAKTINENTLEQQKETITNSLNNCIDNFIKKNIFVLCENISDNPFVTKYILNCCINDESIKNRLESAIKVAVEIIDSLIKLNTEKDLKHLIELQNKYTELYNVISSSLRF